VLPDLTTSLRPRDAIDLALTLSPLRRGPHDPTCRVEAGAWWRATRTGAGAATLRLTSAVDGTINVDAWGPGAAAALEQAPGLCGLRDDPSGFRAEGLIGELHRRHPGLRLCATGAVFETLAPFVLEQRVSGLEAYRSWRKLVRGLSEPAPGPAGLWLPPDPARISAEPYTTFHAFDVEAGRANTLRRAASRARGLERFAQRSPAEATRALVSLPGVGPWTAAMVTAVALADVDAVPVGDYGLPGLVGYALAGERDADDARMLELLEPYAPQRWRAIRLLLCSGSGPARRAPRARARTLRGI
jgi:3-methyladenine DNA glycosylase/8-oxoguanine DNA glycosylase